MRLLSLLIWLFTCNIISAQHFNLENLPKNKERNKYKLVQDIKKYDAYGFDIMEFYNYVKKHNGGSINLLSNDKEISLDLLPIEILSNSFKISTINTKGVHTETEKIEFRTYEVISSENPETKTILYVSPDRLSGEFILDRKLVRINSVPESKSEIIIYLAEDFQESSNHSCGNEITEVTLTGTEADRTASEELECVEIQYSILFDYEAYVKSGYSIQTCVEDGIETTLYTQSVFNNGQLSSNVNFKINNILVVIEEECPPFTDSDKASEIILSYRDWASTNDYQNEDLLTLWTGKDIESGDNYYVIGVASSLVGSSYIPVNVNEYIPGNGLITEKSVLNHEIGHNFTGAHNICLDVPYVMNFNASYYGPAWSEIFQDNCTRDNVTRINDFLSSPLVGILS